MKKLITSLLLSVSVCTFGQSKMSPYTQLYLQAVAQTDTAAAKMQHKLFGLRSADTSEKEVPVFIHFKSADCLAQVEALGGKIGTVTSSMATVRVPQSRLADLEAVDGVTYVEVSTQVRPLMDKAKALTHVNAVHNGESGLSMPYTGKGVVFGVVDMGFEYGHLSFWNKDHTELRVKRVWNQNLSDGTPPEQFAYGTEYTSQEAILEAAYDTSTQTHGTHVTGIAAGSYSAERPADEDDDYISCGAAPDADIVLVSVNSTQIGNGDLSAVLDGVKYVFDYAASVNKPCVVNLSLGSHLGPHDGTSSFDVMTDELQGPGRLITGAVGNEGNYRLHASKAFSAQQPDTLRTFISFVADYAQMSQIDIWGSNPGMNLKFYPIVYNYRTNKLVRKFDPVEVSATKAEKNNYVFTTDEHGLSGQLAIISEMSPLNNCPHMLLATQVTYSDTYRLGFFITSDCYGSVNLWTDAWYSMVSNFGVEGYENGDASGSMGEIGGSGKRIISVGAYTTRPYCFNYGIYAPAKGEILGDLTTYSSYGPTPDGRLKPEVSAPGLYILSSLSSYYTNSVPRVSPVKYENTKYYYGYMSGTSMASPFTAGVLATWLQANPELTPELTKTILQKSSDKDNFTGAIPSQGDQRWGYGKINALAGLKCAIELCDVTSITADGETTAGCVVSIDNTSAHILFTHNSPAASVAVVNTCGMQVKHAVYNNVASADEQTVDLSDLCAGVYILSINDGRNITTQKFIIK